jgi:23S rRNA pseudouridine1911/1915/1917 synthase
MDLDIMYEDDALLVINKSAGCVVHPGAGNPTGTLMNGLLWHNETLATLPRAGIVHRLDKDTTGLMVVAKSLTAHHSLVSQLQERTVSREYLALVNGTLVAGGTLDQPIGRHPIDRKKMAVTESGREAITHYRVEERFPDHTLLAVRLETGRTHQIRVHMAHIRHPLFGDPVYGQRTRFPARCTEAGQACIAAFHRQALHAFRLSLIHPDTQETVSWEAPLPADMRHLLDAFREAAQR